MKVRRAEKLGFCSGVRAADTRVRRFVGGGGHAAILGQVVHNEWAVADMERLGVRTVQSLEEVTEPVVVFSAHGVPPSLHQEAVVRGLEVLDTTCPFVRDIHRESSRALAAGAHLVFIGEPRHREVVGYTKDLDPERFHVVRTTAEARQVDWARFPAIHLFYQTTLNAEEYEDVVRIIEEANPQTRRADTVCYATKQNQEAARRLAADPEIDVVVVIGGTRSANTRHLYELCLRLKPSFLVQRFEDIDPSWFAGVSCVGITAGASTPEAVIRGVEQYLERLPVSV